MAVYQRTRTDAQGQVIRGKWVAERTIQNKRQRREFETREEAQGQIIWWRSGEDALLPGAPPPGVPALVEMIPAACLSIFGGKSPGYRAAQESHMKKFCAWAKAE